MYGTTYERWIPPGGDPGIPPEGPPRRISLGYSGEILWGELGGSLGVETVQAWEASEVQASEVSKGSWGFLGRSPKVFRRFYIVEHTENHQIWTPNSPNINKQLNQIHQIL